MLFRLQIKHFYSDEFVKKIKIFYFKIHFFKIN